MNTARLLALTTVVSITGLWLASAAITTSTSTQSSNTGYGYGYGYSSITSTPTNTSTMSGPGGGTSIVTTTATTIEPTRLFTFKNTICGNEVTDLTDPRLGLTKSQIDTKMTRKDFIKTVLESSSIKSSDFTNVSGQSYSDTNDKYIQLATNYGLVSGENGKFYPDRLISRGEAAKILVNATINLKPTTNIHTFSDVLTSNTLAGYIQTAYDNCILHGRDTTNGKTTLSNGQRIFMPFDTITLGETSKIIYNLTH